MKTRTLLIALLLGVVAACTDNNASVQMQAQCAPTKDCTFSATCDKVSVGYNYVDASLTNRFVTMLQVANELPSNVNLANGKTNTNDAHVDQTVVDFDGPAIPEAVLNTNQRVPANGTTVFAVEVIPSILNAQAALQAWAPPGTPARDMIGNLRLRGYFDDGSRFETGVFPVAIRVCTGCLAQPPLDPVVCDTTSFPCPVGVGQTLTQIPSRCSTP